MILASDSFLFLSHCNSLGSQCDRWLYARHFDCYVFLGHIWIFFFMDIYFIEIYHVAWFFELWFKCCLNFLCFYKLLQVSEFLWGDLSSHWTLLTEDRRAFWPAHFLPPVICVNVFRLGFAFGAYHFVEHFCGCMCTAWCIPNLQLAVYFWLVLSLLHCIDTSQAFILLYHPSWDCLH